MFSAAQDGPLPTLADDGMLPGRPRLDAVLARVAVRLVGLEPEGADEAVQGCLKELAASLGSERVSVAVFPENRRSLRSSYCYLAPGLSASPGDDRFGQAPSSYLEELRAGRRVVVPGGPDGDRGPAAAGRARAPRSTLALPLKAGGEVLGGLQVDHFSAPCAWPWPLVTKVELLAGFLADALFRCEARARLQETQVDLEQARAALEKSLHDVRRLEGRLETENAGFEPRCAPAGGFREIVGTSAALAGVLGQVEQVADTDAPVLLLGETGTGKELVARALHDQSRRRERPLVVVNCAALPLTLVESELFGYEKGAFTGAAQRMLGRFEAAHGGTLFLDEIGELPVEVQAKLLRVLQTGEFERLGSTKTMKVNVRLIAATNRELGREVAEGRFRSDLYYRLSVFPIELPPLRERAEDIPLLVWHFITRRQAALGRAVREVPDRLMRAFTSYSWPGNVRELENVIERALILTNGPSLADDPAFLRTGVSAPPAGEPSSSLADAERVHIRAVLDQCAWKVSGAGNAAERLGLNRTTLQWRMKKLGILRPGNGAGTTV